MSTSDSVRRLKRGRRAPDDARIIDLVRALRKAEADCEVLLPRAPPIRIAPLGAKPDSKRFKVTLHNGRLLGSRLTQLSLGSAYVRGDVDIEVFGDDRKTRACNAMSVFEVRDEMRSGTSVGQALRLAGELALSRPTRVNARAVKHHYSLGDDFYRTFLDPDYRFYSQCMFDDLDEQQDFDDPTTALKKAVDRKLGHMDRSLQLDKSKHNRVLDIGAGWGGLTRYFKGKGMDVEVTSLTLSPDSAKFVGELVEDGGGEVILEDLLEHRRRGYYDAVVIFGVIEHIPTYGRFCRRVWEALKPGGRLYMDASATKQKYAASAFTRRYTWRGPHSCLALPDMIQELLYHGFEIVDVQRGTRDYERTMRAWAFRLENTHDDIAERWGEYVYRMFHVFLWGGVQGFNSNRLQAYTLVAERHEDKGPRPGRLRRAANFAASLR
jgi:cyclopropane-fatty-acyl-phospholipid synthase